MQSRNHFTPFLPDVTVIQLPDTVKARRSFENAAALTDKTHLVIVRVCEIVLSAILIVAGSYLIAMQVGA